MRENEIPRIRGAYFLAEAVTKVLCSRHGITRSVNTVAGFPVPFYTVRRPWSRKVILGPFNFVPDYLDLTGEVVAAACAFASERGATASLRVYGEVPDELKARLGIESAIDSFETLVPTEGGMEGVHARMRPRHRSKISRLLTESAGSGVSIRRFDDAETFDRFYRVLTEAYLKRHVMIPPPYHLLRDLLSCSGPAASTFGYVAERSGNVLGGILVMADPAQWIYAWGATSPAAMDLDVSSLLLHRAIEDAIAAQIPVFSLGMTPVSHTGLAQYKRGWSKLERPAGYAVLGAALPDRDPHSSFRLARKVVTSLPVPAIRMLTPLIYRTMV